MASRFLIDRVMQASVVVGIPHFVVNCGEDKIVLLSRLEPLTCDVRCCRVYRGSRRET